METFLFNKIRIAAAILILAAGALSASAADREQRAPSSVSRVTVFLDQAQVTRTSKISLQPGVTDLVFDRVSPFINLNSIQVKTEANVTLLSVSQRNNYLLKEEKPAFILEIEDTVGAIKQSLELLRIRKEALDLEKDLLVSNKHIGGANNGVQVEDLEEALVLFRKRSIEIGEEQLRISNSQKRLNAVLSKFQSQLDEYLKNVNSTVEIVVTVKTLSAVKDAAIEWSYLVGNTSWTPFYDIRVKDTKSPLELVSKAYITQNTGEDWKNVVMKLSTANPNESGTLPDLRTNFIGYRQPYRALAAGHKKEMMMERDVAGEVAPLQEIAAWQGNAAVAQTAVNIEFNVTSAYSIPSDNNPHQVDLTVNNLQAQYSYAAIPRLDKDAFVTAKVSGNELINQVSGEANVYFDGTFTGRTAINGTTGDSMLLSLGRDKRIQIQRVLLKDFSSRNFSGSTKKEANTWEITVRNTRKEAIEILIQDQVPVSTEKDIEVKVQQAAGASYDETTGKLSWILRIEPEQSQTVRFSFEVKYPKDKQVTPY